MPDWKEYVRQNLRLKDALPEQESEAIDEVARQLEDAYSDALHRGLSPANAEAEARQHIADWEAFAKELRHTTRHRSSTVQRFVREAPSEGKPLIFESLKQDLRYSLRTFLKKPAFFVLAVLTLALGIGANTAIFSIVNAVLLRPLPYKAPDRLVEVYERRPRQNRERNPASPADFYDWRAQNQSFASTVALLNQNVNLTESGQPERLLAGGVSSGFFETLGVTPSQGRTFAAGEEEIGSHRVAILSDGLWKRRFNSDAGIVGRTIALNSEPYTVVGILPDSFRFGGGGESQQIWIPLAMTPQERANRGLHFLSVFGRLKDGVTLEQARGEMLTISQQLESQNPVNIGHYTNVFPLYDEVVGDVRQSLVVLLGAVGFVLLIACANVANLLLLRTSSRRKEIAIRNAVGATRSRTIRQFLTECVALSLAGGSIGVALSVALVPALIRLAPGGTPRMDEINLDFRVFAFTFVISVVTGLAFGLVPALQVSKLDLNAVLKDAGRSGSGGTSANRLRSGLIVSEVAIALMLLTGAGLMIRSLSAVQSVSLGFERDNVLTMQIALPRAKYKQPSQILGFFNEVRLRIAGLPGVRSAGGAMGLPSSGGLSTVFFAIDGKPPRAPGQGLNTGLNVVTPGYFETMGVPLLKGRTFSESDTENSPLSIVINETMLRQFWPGEDPIGQSITAGGKAASVIGIVGDTRQDGPLKPARPEMFYAFAQNPSTSLNLVVRTTTDPMSLVSPIRAEVHALDPEQPIAAVRTMEQVLTEATVSTRFNTFLLGGFAFLAFLLATVGLYGVMAFFVTQRTQEIGIRMALGACKREVVQMILGHGLKLVSLGLVIGIAASLALTRFLTTLLFGVSARDPWTIGAVGLLLLITAALACYIPARRAAAVDPIIAVRYE